MTSLPKFLQTRDIIVRAIVVIWFAMVETLVAYQIVILVRTTSRYDAAGLIHLVSQVCVLLFVAMIVWFTVVRGRPTVKAQGLQARVAALLGTNLILIGVFYLPEGADFGMIGSVISSVLILTGHFLDIIVIRHLGRSFSIMAEARGLVTDGPYAIVRHPLYLVEEIATIGVLIQLMSWPAVILFATHFVIQLQRIQNEEAVLLRAFPHEYAAYAARTARLLPGVW